MGTERRCPVLVARLVAALLVGVLSGQGYADSWAPWPEQRVVDPHGRYYVVLKRTEERSVVSWRFVERGEGSTPVESARENTRKSFEERNDPPADVSMRAGDSLISEGRLTQRPLHIFVSTSGWGFVVVERHGGIGYGDSVTLIPREGKPVALKLTDIFDADTIAAFTCSVSSIQWYGGAWIDEEEKDLILLSKGGILRVVDLETAEVKSGGEAEVRRGVRCKDPRGLGKALELAVSMDLRGLKDDLLPVLSDEAVTLGPRLRAALLLARSGDETGRSLIVRVAGKPADEPDPSYGEDRRFALEHLPELLGDDAIPLLLKILETEADTRGAPKALATYGPRILGDLERIVREGKGYAPHRAVHAIAAIGSRRAMPLLLRMARHEKSDLANSAVNAAIGLWGTDIADELADMLREGTTQDRRIAGFFAEHRYRDAIPALVTALDRQPKNSSERRRIVKALVFQTGEKLGDDPAAWKKWLDSQRR